MKRIVEMEWTVLMRRSSARGLLLVSALLPVLVALTLWGMSRSEMTLNEQPIADVLSFSGPHAATLSLRIRHALVLPIFILFVTGSSFATERANHMLRERLVRPVSRDTMLMAKLSTLLMLCALSLLINMVLAVSLGSVLMGTDGPWWLVFVGHVASISTDLGLISLGVLLSTLCRSGAMVVVSGILIYLFDQMVNVGLFLVGLAGVDGMGSLQQFLPSTGWNVWTVMLGEGQWVSALNLMVWTTIFLLYSRHRLHRMDVP